jgi:cation diffusion facilitator CzcD-associated flavoprotein CzcO
MPSRDDDVSRRYEVVVIGAGPAGEAAAEPDVLRAMRLPSRAHQI